MAYGVLEPATGHYCYAIAGHNPPIWIHAGGTAGTVPGRGIALGVLDQVEYQEQEIRLEAGDALLLYTDGLTEAVNMRLEEFGWSHVLDVVRANCAGSARELLQALTSAVDAHVGEAEVFDDMTIVVVKRTV